MNIKQLYDAEPPRIGGNGMVGSRPRRRKRRGRVGGGASLPEAETVAYITGLTTPLSSGQVTLIDTLVKTLKTGLSITNLSDAFDAMWIFAGETEESSLKNLIKNSHHAVLAGATPPTFAAAEGFTGDGLTGYINTNYNPVTQGVNFTLNSNSYGVYSRTNANSEGTSMGLRTSTSDYCHLTLFSAGSGSVTATRNCQVAPGSIAIALPTTAGLFISNRGTDASHDLFYNTAKVSQIAASTSLPSANFMILCRNNNGAAESFNTRQISFAFTAKAVIQGDVDVITSVFETYMDALGKGVIA